MSEAVLGVIGGSGLYDLPELTDAEWVMVDSPWGAPSDALRIGRVDGLKVVFLPRHGRGHRYAPSDINYRANIDAMKRCGVTSLVSVSACGSLNEAMAPGTFVLVDQFIDRTFAREKSFFGKGCVAHVSMAEPVAPLLVGHIAAAADAEGLTFHKGGTYLAMEGPQFSSLAESELYRSWKCDVIGMTNMPEAKLAREAEICYATVAMVTDYDSWHPDHGSVDIQAIIRVLHENADNARRLIARLARDLPRTHEACPIGSDTALEYAMMTAPEVRDPDLVAKLDAVAGRMLQSAG
jgi:5'-methylthioadenosine phosphorylase